MKLIYSGGLDKYASDGYEKSYFYKYSDTVKKLVDEGKKVCFVTMAKPNHYYDKHIHVAFADTVDIIGDAFENPAWDKYDLIFLCGGDTLKLKKGLLDKKFDFNNLKETAVVLGDSAGAMIMAPWFYDVDKNDAISFQKGLYSENKCITVVHTNNPRYCNDTLIEAVEKFAKDQDIKVIKLNEYEEKFFDTNTRTFIQNEIFTF